MITSYILHLYNKKGKRVARYDTKTYGRFLHQTRLILNKISHKKGYRGFLRVNYGKAVNVFGENVLFWNSMDFYTPQDLNWGIMAFVKEYQYETNPNQP